MSKIKIGILGAADIAVNKFLPALVTCTDFEYVGVASKSGNNVNKIKEQFGGKVYTSYEELLEDNDVDAVYIPLHPKEHYEWAMRALTAGKHVILEKPFCTKSQDALKLLQCAQQKNLAIVENFAFLYHNQFDSMSKYLSSGEIGKVRLINCRFGYPKRAADKFRYSKELGGGALLDCGVYPIKAISALFHLQCKVLCAKLNIEKDYDVDLYGSATLESKEGVVAQIAFGMDNEYQCSLEIWGSKGKIYSPRFFTAPENYSPVLTIIKSGVEEHINVPACNQFERMIRFFRECIVDDSKKISARESIKVQSQLVDQIIKMSK